MDGNFFQETKKIIKNIAMILSWTLFVILLAIIGFLVYYLVSANIYASKGEKYKPEFSLYTIVSPSMEPNINVYDVILNTKIDDPHDIKVGDVITFISTSTISDGMTVTHRVTKVIEGKDGLEFKTKGDNNLSEDTDTAKEKNVLGKVFIKIPQLGRLQFFISSKGGWLLIVICPALFIIVNDIFKIFKLNKAKKALNDAENEPDNRNKLELESFRKEEIKEKLNNKELKKAKKLEEKIKAHSKKQKENEIQEEINNIENAYNPTIEAEKENFNENNEMEKEEIMFIEDTDDINNEKVEEEPMFIVEEDMVENPDNIIEETVDNYVEIKPVFDEHQKVTNIFDEIKEKNIFDDDESVVKKIVENPEPIKKVNDFPLELPKLKK